MYKLIINISGMKCGMCEAHVNDLFRKNLKLKKVKSNHKRNTTIIISKDNYSKFQLNQALSGSGYFVTDMISTTAKKTFLGWK